MELSESVFDVEIVRLAQVRWEPVHTQAELVAGLIGNRKGIERKVN